MTIGVTDHAVERYLQRVRGVLDPRPEIAGRVRAAWEAGRVSDAPRGTWSARISSTSACSTARATSWSW